MKKIFPVTLTLLFATLACNAVLPQTQPTIAPATPVISTLPAQEPSNIPLTEADVPRITVEEAKAAFDRGEAVIVDVRSAEFYAEGHITGSISVPLAGIEINPAAVPMDKSQWIITYCT